MDKAKKQPSEKSPVGSTGYLCDEPVSYNVFKLYLGIKPEKKEVKHG